MTKLDGSAMIGWLSRSWREAPKVKLADRELPIVIRRLERARRMTLRLSPDGSEVRISIPQQARSADALSFVHSRSDWLAGQLAKLNAAVPIAPGGSVPYRGSPLRVDWHAQAPRRPLHEDGRLRIGGPLESLEARLRRWLEAEARRLLTEELAHYAAAAGLSPPPLALSNARRRWGSCSQRGAIRINWRLVMAPDDVRRSVVAHEVAHMLHFDHSPKFHAALGDLFEGDIAAANRWLKRESRALYSVFA